MNPGSLQRRERRREWLARLADAALGLCLLGALAMTLAPLMVDFLRTDARNAIEAEEAFAADQQAGLFAAQVTGVSLTPRPLPAPDEGLRR